MLLGGIADCIRFSNANIRMFISMEPFANWCMVAFTYRGPRRHCRDRGSAPDITVVVKTVAGNFAWLTARLMLDINTCIVVHLSVAGPGPVRSPRSLFKLNPSWYISLCTCTEFLTCNQYVKPLKCSL